jgi:hypothetical protein
MDFHHLTAEGFGRQQELKGRSGQECFRAFHHFIVSNKRN